MSQKNLKHLESIKDAIKGIDELSEDEKSQAFKRVEEWYAEDKALGILSAKLSEVSKKIVPILEEMGLL